MLKKTEVFVIMYFQPLKRGLFIRPKVLSGFYPKKTSKDKTYPKAEQCNPKA
jgi:hypothetical protein